VAAAAATVQNGWEWGGDALAWPPEAKQHVLDDESKPMPSGACAKVYECKVPAIEGSRVELPQLLVKKDMNVTKYPKEKLRAQARHLLWEGEQSLRVLRTKRATVQLYGVAVYWEDGVPTKIIQLLEHGGKDLECIQAPHLHPFACSGITWAVRPDAGADPAVEPKQYSFTWGQEGFHWGGIQLVGYSVTRSLAIMHDNNIVCRDAKLANFVCRKPMVVKQHLMGQKRPRGKKQRRAAVNKMGVSVRQHVTLWQGQWVCVLSQAMILEAGV
jgi:hypothetical protein